ncbi:hypothetical protein PInf_014734 [Phytophthora infestans]|nr:hypothetical protein PInf_014734 [Phytophthora infestans]
MAVRAWSWTRIDGRNVLAVPTQTEIRLYDSDDFILLSRLAPSGHRSPVAFVRWSAFHGRLASLSSSLILVHAPQRDPQVRGRVQFVAICSFHLSDAHVSIRGLAFSRSADELLYCGVDAGLGKLDVRGSGSSVDQAPVLWQDESEATDVAKYSPTAFVFATLTMKQNISDENFQVVNDVNDTHADWISGVDRDGILRLWRVVGIVSSKPTVEETTLQIKVNGEDDKQTMGVNLGEACVMAYFSQNYFGMPSKLGVVLQRADHIMLSFHVAVGEGDRPSQILKKSWYRSHLGSISALSAHPSLPLIASVDTHLSGVQEPTQRRKLARSPSLSPWTFFDYVTGESGFEYEVTCEKPANTELGVQFEERKGKLIVSRSFAGSKCLGEVVEGDELVGINNKSVVGKEMNGVFAWIDKLPPQEPLLLRFRAACVQNYHGTMGQSMYEPSSQLKTSDAFQPASSSSNGGDVNTEKHSVEEYASDLRRSFLASLEKQNPRSPSRVRDGAKSSFELVPLQIQDPAIEKKANITAIAGERDYRQRAFTSKRAQVTITSVSQLARFVDVDMFLLIKVKAHIEVDDPNRLAVLHADQPEELYVFEAESGLGILRPEESIPSNGRGHILGFTWCNSHVEFNVDALAWDEPGSLLQHAMDWKAAESPQKLPVWHPYVLLTTMFGMHARVGEKDTVLAGDRTSYEFSRAFKDATQMLKLLAKVLEHEPSARASASSGVLSYTGPARSKRTALSENGHARMLESVGRYSTSIHRSDRIDRAENLFAAPMSRDNQKRYSYDEDESFTDEDDQRTLGLGEAATILTAVESMLEGKTHALQDNASELFTSFSEDHLLEMKALLSFVDAIQSLGFDLDASAADLGAKRFFSMHLFANSLRSVVLAHTGNSADSVKSNPQTGESEALSGKLKWRNSYSERDVCFWLPSLEETPSSGLLWALHSDAQQFLWEHCIQPSMQWDDIRPLWLGLWIKDVKDLRGIVERFAKVSYARTKDAMDVCLLYLALGKKKVLSALAKLTQSESNKTLASFLDNDFFEKRWSNAAVKNAYSLLSKKKYEPAAAFFLLCEPPRIQDAVRVLSMRLGDPSLALVIARLVEYETDKLQHDFSSNQAGITPAGEITKQLLEQEIVPLFRRKREVWLESCALWWLEEFEQAWAVLLPQCQDVGVCGGNEATLSTKSDLVSGVMRATHFYVNLTSLTVYFQHLHSMD